MVVTEQYCVIFYYYTDLELNAPPACLYAFHETSGL